MPAGPLQHERRDSFEDQEAILSLMPDQAARPFGLLGFRQLALTRAHPDKPVTDVIDEVGTLIRARRGPPHLHWFAVVTLVGLERP